MPDFNPQKPVAALLIRFFDELPTLVCTDGLTISVTVDLRYSEATNKNKSKKSHDMLHHHARKASLLALGKAPENTDPQSSLKTEAMWLAKGRLLWLTIVQNVVNVSISDPRLVFFHLDLGMCPVLQISFTHVASPKTQSIAILIIDAEDCPTGLLPRVDLGKRGLRCGS